MKTLIYYNIKLFIVILCFPFLFISCKKETATENTLDQLFRPVMLEADINGNSVLLSWEPIAGASYSLEIARDSLLFETNLQVFPLDKVSEYLINDLMSNSRYSARIKAISKISAVKNSGYKQITFVTGN